MFSFEGEDSVLEVADFGFLRVDFAVLRVDFAVLLVDSVGEGLGEVVESGGCGVSVAVAFVAVVPVGEECEDY